MRTPSSFGVTLSLGGEVIVLVGHLDLHAAPGVVYLPGGNVAEDVPLLGSIHQTDAASGADALAALDDLETGEFLVIETSVVKVVVNEDIGPSCLEIVEVVHFQGLSTYTRHSRGGQDRHREKKFFHKDKWYLGLIIIQ